MTNIYYFAFGSNMDLERIVHRNLSFEKRESAKLKDYKLLFNKRASKAYGQTFANIEPQEDSFVEGILYHTNEESIDILDAYEGYPEHYTREFVNVVRVGNKIVQAITYIANPRWIGEGKPSKKYLNFLLAGKDFLTTGYFEKLRNIKTFD